MRPNALLVAAALATAVCVAGEVKAQTTAAAEALFDKGLKDMMAGDYDSGCPALAESYRLEPKVGALFTLAECESKAGKIASARAHYDDYLRLFEAMPKNEQAAQRGRDKAALAQRDALASRVPHVTLQLPEGAPATTVVRVDGTQFQRPALGLELPIDPGPHMIVVEVPGRPPRELRVELAEGENKTVVLELPEAVVPSDDGAEPAPAPVPPPDTPDEESSSQATWAYVAGGIGIVGVGVGAVTGGLTFAQKSTVDEHCTGGVCDAEGIDAVDRGKVLGLTSTVAFIVGAVGLGTAATLFLTDSSGNDEAEAGERSLPSIAIGPSGGGVEWSSRW